jgi:hypothetical protein
MHWPEMERIPFMNMTPTIQVHILHSCKVLLFLYLPFKSPKNGSHQEHPYNSNAQTDAATGPWGLKGTLKCAL